jgi:hypothetical protein
MAKYTQGIHGPFEGKIGKVIGSSWKGMPYLKSVHKKRSTPPRELEIFNRKKWALSQRWLAPLVDFVREGFRGYSARSEGFVAAKSYLLKNAFEEVDDEPVINPALVKVSSGSLPLPAHISATKIDEEHIQFSWDTKRPGDSKARDQIMMLAYNIDKGEAEMEITGEFRKTGSGVLEIDSEITGIWHLYAAFIAWDRSRQSDSVYLGTITV